MPRPASLPRRPHTAIRRTAGWLAALGLGLAQGGPATAQEGPPEPAPSEAPDAGAPESGDASQEPDDSHERDASSEEDGSASQPPAAAQPEADTQSDTEDAGPGAEAPPATSAPVSASQSAAPALETTAPPPSPAAQESAQSSRAPVEVTVRASSKAERLRRSAEAVHVVETEEVKRQATDMGEVLARTQGVSVQRAGGLGSDTRFSLNGMTDDQIRFFLDGVPLEFAGYPFGISNVPVNLVERVEIYRGVVPIRYGADALGGAVNLVTDQDIRGTHATASYQAGSFGTYRLTLGAQHLHEPSGWFTRVSGFLDWAENNYPMDIEVPDERGREEPARVYRFHDAYRAQGGAVETGVVDKPWAKRLLLRAFATNYDKEVQHNLLMTFNPYGDVQLGERSTGATLRYENTFARNLSVNAVGGYVYRGITYKDVGECVYDWFGRCLRPRAQPGERVGRAQDQLYQDQSGFARVNVGVRIRPEHNVRLSLSPSFTARTGDERRQANPDARDPLSAQRELFALVSGLEYKLDVLDHRLENVVFVKDYLQVLRSEDPLPNGTFRRRDRDTHRGGLGDALRYSFAEWIYAKASYEWATRLPRPDEIFGNAFPVGPNLELKPELSHNLNLGVTADGQAGRAGKLRGDVNAFLRNADQLIVLVGNDQAAQYQNVYKGRSLGAEVAAGWTSPGEYVALDGNFTYVDFRNTSTEGAFAANEGQRIPNRPYLFGNGSARLQAHDVGAPRAEVALTWTTRYVHQFLRGWEDLGTDKLTVPAQLLHFLALTYFVENDSVALSFAGEVHNITDQAAFDFFGVPRPGRAFYFKATASL